MASRGTKVHDPHSIIQESPGPITADSLAAESTRSGGAFSRNPNSEPQGVAGPNSTFTTTNTTGATRLDPASDAEARMAQRDWAEEKKLSMDGPFPADEAGMGRGAPVQRSHHGREGGPKGSKLTEGGFESDDRRNVSFTSEIGSEDDPSRKTERAFETLNADGDTALPRQKGVDGDTPFKDLESETSA